jgi:hypothetical protein
MRGSRPTSSTPALAATASSQPWKSNSGTAVMATVVSIAPSPHRARLATACAGQYPAASGCSDTSQPRNRTSSPDIDGSAPGSPPAPRASP